MVLRNGSKYMYIYIFAEADYIPRITLVLVWTFKCVGGGCVVTRVPCRSLLSNLLKPRAQQLPKAAVGRFGQGVPMSCWRECMCHVGTTVVVLGDCGSERKQSVGGDQDVPAMWWCEGMLVAPARL